MSAQNAESNDPRWLRWLMILIASLLTTTMLIYLCYTGAAAG